MIPRFMLGRHSVVGSLESIDTVNDLVIFSKTNDDLDHFQQKTMINWVIYKLSLAALMLEQL